MALTSLGDVPTPGTGEAGPAPPKSHDREQGWWLSKGNWGCSSLKKEKECWTSKVTADGHFLGPQ